MKPSLLEIARSTNLRPFSRETYVAKDDAQVNLRGLTHYADSDTLRYHSARILETRHTPHGLAMGLVESVALDCRNTARGFRAVVFAIDGTVIFRQDLDSCYKSKGAALRALEEYLAGPELLPAVAKALHTTATRLQREAYELSAAAAVLLEV